jgi:hypothetical protein
VKFAVALIGLAVAGARKEGCKMRLGKSGEADEEADAGRWKEMAVEGDGGGRRWRWKEMAVEGDGGGRRWRCDAACSL